MKERESLRRESYREEEREIEKRELTVGSEFERVRRECEEEKNFRLFYQK